ncbi:hypothetical protein ACHAWO_000416 [Cyclotella atomus]|uniref:Uncharacterized protein n=1 Tax=Cyclotella atomus TaxID=382360 RepID=A0ABD3QBR5_9STRA
MWRWIALSIDVEQRTTKTDEFKYCSDWWLSSREQCNTRCFQMTRGVIHYRETCATYKEGSVDQPITKKSTIHY